MDAHAAKPPVEFFVGATDLRRRGAEWVGPCPLCGGDDRFHVGEGSDGAALVGCRGCIDGEPKAVRAKRYGEVLRATGYDSSTRALPVARAGNVTVRQVNQGSRRSVDTAAAAATAGMLWRNAHEALNTPGHAYLTGRDVWPADHELPPSVRWLPRATATQIGNLKGWSPRWLDRDAAGCLTFLYTGATAGCGVALQQISSDGVRLAWAMGGGTRVKCRQVGGKRGLYLRVGCLDSPVGVAVCEGEATALAASWLYPNVEVRAYGGSAGVASAEVATDGCILIIPDGDTAGRNTARALLERYPQAEVDRWRRGSDGRDAADDLRAIVQARGWEAVVSVAETMRRDVWNGVARPWDAALVVP